MKFIEDLDMRGRVVLLRALLNVPLKKGRIKDDFRLQAMLPSISYCQKNAKKTVILGHLGRPETWDAEEFGFEPVAKRLSELLNQEVLFYPDCRGKETKAFIDEAKDGSIILLENVRKYKEERKNDEAFGKELASFGDVFIEDAFGDVYGEYASVMWPPQVLPSAIGYRIRFEMQSLDRLKDKPKHPFVVLVGGTKIKEKLGALRSLARQADKILVGGGIANTILAAQGVDVKDSFMQADEFEVAKAVMRDYPDKIVLPSDLLVAKHADDEHYDVASLRTTTADQLQGGESILDIGPATLKSYIKQCKAAKDIFWAGTMGYFEWKPTSSGSIDLAKALAKMKNFTGVGGGETAEVFEQAGVAGKIDYVSTGGGAALTYLAGEELPGLKIMG